EGLRLYDDGGVDLDAVQVDVSRVGAGRREEQQGHGKSQAGEHAVLLSGRYFAPKRDLQATRRLLLYNAFDMGETFRAADGPTSVDLWAEDYPSARQPPRASVLIVHGYAEHGGRYADVARRLAGAGFAVSTFDYRGHGRAGGPRGHCDRFTDY